MMAYEKELERLDGVIRTLVKELTHTQAKAAKYKQALEWYANHQKLSIYDPLYPHTEPLWERARAALKETP